MWKISIQLYNTLNLEHTLDKVKGHRKKRYTVEICEHVRCTL